MKKVVIILIIFTLVISGCENEEKEITQGEFQLISGQEAYEMMISEEINNLIILDVRNAEKFAESRIDGAINVPLLNIEKKIENIVPDKDATILVYCKSGVRAKLASEKLVDLGYTNVYDFGGIDTWEYGTVNPVE